MKNKIKNNKKIIYIVIVVMTFFAGGISMYGYIYYHPLSTTTTNDITATSSSNSATALTSVKRNVTVTDTGLGEAVSKVYDSVVVVSTYKNNKLYGSGTGFVYKVDGNKAYILTNNHVIESGNKVTVTFTDGDVVETEIVGTNSLVDIAVLSVSKNDIVSVAEIGSSEDLVVGDTTFAVGAPLDDAYSWTVTRGILSGKDRMVEVSLSNNNGEYIMKVLQTDAAINSGNSGGPLCNANGEVIGITSLKLVSSGVEGMGFAIPIETAVEYANKIINNEKITQPYLGITMMNVSDASNYISYSRLLNNITSGVVVASTEKNSPADKSGLQVGDVITKINDKNVSSVGYLRYYLYELKSGDKVKITYVRNGEEKETTVTLGTSSVTY